MAINFPNSPANGQTFNPPGGYQYIYLDGVWRVVEASQNVTADARNRVVNPAFQITQEYARSTNFTGGAAFADQWITSWIADGTISGFANVPNTYIGADAGPYCCTLVIGTADAAMAAGQYLMFYQPIEGNRIADFLWGTASALPVVVRFKATSTIAATFAVSIKNAASNRCYVKNCTIAANTPTWFTIPIPGDTTGTWAIDNTQGLQFNIALAAGTTYQAPSEGVWTAGGFLVTAATGNYFATTGARFSFGAVGLYLDPLNTGIPPRWQLPDEAAEMLACHRYFRRIVYPADFIGMYGYNVGTAGEYRSFTLSPPMRTAFSGSFSGTWVVSNATGIGFSGTLGPQTFTLTTSVVATSAYVIQNSNSGAGLTMNARM